MEKDDPNYTLVFVLNSILFFFSGLAKFIYTPLLSPLKNTLSISSTQAGSLITLVYLGYAFTRFPSGILTDIYGCKKTIIYSSFLTGLSLLLLSFSPNYLILAILSFIMGGATGLYTTAGYTFSVLIGKTGKETTSTALLELFGGTASFIAPLAVILFLENLDFSWNSLFLTAGIGVIITSFLFAYFMKGKSIKKTIKSNPENQNDFKEELTEILEVFKHPNIRKFIIWATLVGGFGCFALKGFESFIPTALAEVKNYSFSNANKLFSIIAVSGLITKMGVAWAADRFGVKRIFAAITALNLIFFIVFTLNISHYMIILTLIVFGITFKSHNTLINSYVMKKSPEKYQGSGFGLFSTLYTIIYSLGPMVIGFFIDKFGLLVGMRFSLIGVFISLPLVLSFKYFINEKQLG
ncbi:MAG: MFS transporter [Bacillota bacterium]